MKPKRRSKAKQSPAATGAADNDLAPFTQPGPSLWQVLVESGLEIYAPAFQQHMIDEELAQTMTTADLRALLPNAPYGDCLRMHVLFRDAFQRQPLIPTSPGWRLPGLVLANGQISGKLMEQYRVWCDNVLIIGSLMLGLAIEPWQEVPSECADGTACETLLMVDYVVWSMAVCSLFLAAFTAFVSSAFLPQLLTEEDAPRFILDNWLLHSLPKFACALGLVCLSTGFGTRALITLDSARGQMGATASAVAVVGVFAYFYRMLMQVADTQCSELLALQFSFFGFNTGRCE